MQKNTLLFIALILIIILGIAWYTQAPSDDGPAGITPTDETATNSDMLGGEAAYEVEASEVAYFAEVQGHFAEPTAPGDYPGVVMIHEWWGLNDNIRDMAERLAGEGYRVLAVDLYNGEVAGTPESARELVGGLDQEEATANLQAATLFLEQQGSARVASLGWCFGGGQSLQLALSGAELDATVIYYGNLVTDQAELTAIDWPVLGIFGGEDTSIPVESVRGFQSALSDLGVENNIHIYPGVGHAFANPSGDNYAPSETQDAWTRTLEFLNEHLQT